MWWSEQTDWRIRQCSSQTEALLCWSKCYYAHTTLIRSFNECVNSCNPTHGDPSKSSDGATTKWTCDSDSLQHWFSSLACQLGDTPGLWGPTPNNMPVMLTWIANTCHDVAEEGTIMECKKLLKKAFKKIRYMCIHSGYVGGGQEKSSWWKVKT